jgi:hypothetical protein
MKAKRKSAIIKRGGRRPGAGRPPAHTVQLLVRLKPVTAKMLKYLADELELTPSQWLDQCVAESGSKAPAQMQGYFRVIEVP